MALTHLAKQQRWQPGGSIAGNLQGYDEHINKASQGSAYTTTADVGLADFTYNRRPGPVNLPVIDEDRSLVPVPESPAVGGPTTNPIIAATPRPPINTSGAPTNWMKGEPIGAGAFGTVYLGMDNETGELMAVKQVSLAAVDSAAESTGGDPARGAVAVAQRLKKHVQDLEEEVHLLQELQHPNIVRYLGTEKIDDALNIFLEYVPGGSIASLLARFGSFKESVIKVYAKQILTGLEYLHSHGIIHRDIKGANILVDNTGLVKLADFGASKKIEDLVTMESGFKSVKGTPYWMAPEVIRQEGHGRQADIWSVACTIIEMATGRPPWSQYNSQVSAMFAIAQAKGPPSIPEGLSAECKDFLYLCFNRDWKRRPSASTLLQHPFLAGVPKRTVAAPLNNLATHVEGEDDVCDSMEEPPLQRTASSKRRQSEPLAMAGVDTLLKPPAIPPPKLLSVRASAPALYGYSKIALTSTEADTSKGTDKLSRRSLAKQQPVEIPATVVMNVETAAKLKQSIAEMEKRAVSPAATLVIPTSTTVVVDGGESMSTSTCRDSIEVTSNRSAAPTDSTSTGGTSTSYNPMEEPEWLMHTVCDQATKDDTMPVESDNVNVSHNGGSLSSATTVPLQNKGGLAWGTDITKSISSESTAPVKEKRGLVWTDVNGSIDRLPWDVGSDRDSWESGSIGTAVAMESEQPQTPQRKMMTPADQEEILRTLKRRANEKIRTSQALFDKSGVSVSKSVGVVRKLKVEEGYAARWRTSLPTIVDKM